MKRLTFAVDHAGSSHAAVDYRWDTDTDILTAKMAVPEAKGMTGSVEIEGPDGSWVVLDVRGGLIAGIEVAVWPDVAIVDTLVPRADVVDGLIALPARAADTGVASVELDLRVAAQADKTERTIHFRFGPARGSRAVRAARDILIELDDLHQIAGIWLLNVPPFPGAK